MEKFNLESFLIGLIKDYKYNNVIGKCSLVKTSIYFNCSDSNLIPDTYIKRKTRAFYGFLQSGHKSEDIDTVLLAYVAKGVFTPSYINAKGRSTNTIQGYRLENFRG